MPESQSLDVSHLRVPSSGGLKLVDIHVAVLRQVVEALRPRVRGEDAFIELARDKELGSAERAELVQFEAGRLSLFLEIEQAAEQKERRTG